MKNIYLNGLIINFTPMGFLSLKLILYYNIISPSGLVNLKELDIHQVKKRIMDKPRSVVSTVELI